MTRIQIGHTKLTHGHLLEGAERPFCISCLVDLTVRHILLECPEFGDIRGKYFKCGDIKTLFDVVDQRRLLDFLKEIGLFNKL